MPLDDGAQAVQEARLAHARSRSVFIATPIARQPARQFMNSLCMTVIHLARLGIRAYVQQTAGSSNIPRSRNELVAAFMASDYSNLLFIDDDMGWHPNDVVRLLASDKPIIAGVGSKKRILPDNDPRKWCIRIPDDWRMVQDEFGAIEVEAVGTGFMLVERQVFSALAAAHPEWKRKGWDNLPDDVRAWYYRFFVFDSEHPDEPGEDFGFCWAWRALGGQVWVDPAIRLVHVGEHEFGGDFTAILEPEGSQ